MPGAEGVILGKYYEALILRLLQTQAPAWVIGPVWEGSRIDDEAGIDLFVDTIYGRVPIQVKSKVDNKIHPNTRLKKRRFRYEEAGIAYVTCKSRKNHPKEDAVILVELLTSIQKVLHVNVG